MPMNFLVTQASRVPISARPSMRVQQKLPPYPRVHSKKRARDEGAEFHGRRLSYTECIGDCHSPWLVLSGS